MSLSVRFWKNKHAQKVIARAIACSMLLLALPSCGIPHLRDAMPGPALPGSFNGLTSAENSALVPIEDFFTDPLLTNLICQALSGGNFELRILYEDVRIARNEILARSGAYLPFVGLGADAGLERSSDFTPLGAAEKQLQYLPGKNFPYMPGNFLVAADISWQIDIWRQLRNARDAAKLRFLATNEGRNYVITRLVAEIADNYYMLLALDKRLENLNQIIALQQKSLDVIDALMKAGRTTKLAVLRFQAEIRMNQSQLQITRQTIIEVENRINFLVGRYPQPVERNSRDFFALNVHTLDVGLPAQLLQNRPDIRQAERELAAAGLDVLVARANFFPKLTLTGPTGPLGPYSPIGFQAFNPKYLLWTPESLVLSVAGDLTVPLINKRAIRADYMNANARQLQAIYNYQRTTLNAFTEVVNRVTKVQNYSRSIEIKRQQVETLIDAVKNAIFLVQRPQARILAEHPTTYLDVLLVQRDLWEARLLLIETKQQQLSAIVGVYQALGGGLLGCGCGPKGPRPPRPGISVDPSQQGGSDLSGSDLILTPDKQSEQPGMELPAPRKQPEQPEKKLPAPGKQPEQPDIKLPAPRKQPEQLSGPDITQPDGTPEARKPPTHLPPPDVAVE